MSIGQLPYPEQVTFPPVDHDQVTPSVDDVALLVATRTMDSSSTQLGHFTDDTNPTDAQVAGLIAQAVTLVLTPFPDYLPQSLYGRIRQAVALQAAILVETSFYREQANLGSIAAMTTALDAMSRAIQEDTGGAGVSQRVDTVVLRSTMADYDPYYVMPPPPVVGTGGYWSQSQPPTGPASVSSISPPAWSVTNDQSVIVAATGFNFAVAEGLVAHLQDSTGQEVTTTAIVDPSGQGTMLVATFPAPDPATPLGAGWFYLTLNGSSYGALEPWEWIA